MKTFFLVFIFLFFLVTVFGATVNFQDVQMFSSSEIKINKIISKDNKILVVGSNENEDMYYGIIENDDLIFENTIVGEKEDYLSDVLISGDGSIYLLGFSDSKTGIFEDQRGFGDIILVKLNSQYEVEWLRHYGGNLLDRAYDIIESSDDYIYVCGMTNSSNVENYSRVEDAFVIKVDTEGNEEWNKAYGTYNAEQFNDIVQIGEDNFVLTGYRSINDKSVSCNYTNIDLILSSISGDGNLNWEKVYGGFYEEKGFSIVLNDDKLFILGSKEDISSFLSEGYGKTDFWVLNTDLNGELIEEYVYGGSSQDYPKEMYKTEDGLILAGTTKSDDGLLKMYKKDKVKEILIFEIDFSGNISQTIILGNKGENDLNDVAINGNNLFVSFVNLENNYIFK